MAQSKIFGAVRCVWPTLAEPKAFQEGGKAKYSITVLVPKTDKVACKKWEDFVMSSINANGAWKETIKKQVFAAAKKTLTDEGRNKNCVLCDGDLLNEQALAEDKTVRAEYAGMMVIKLSRPASFGAPLVCRQDREEIPGALISTEVQPGYWVNVEVSPYVYTKPVNGISLQLQAVQLVRKDAVFGRSNNFDEVEVSEEETAESFSE